MRTTDKSSFALNTNYIHWQLHNFVYSLNLYSNCLLFICTYVKYIPLNKTKLLTYTPPYMCLSTLFDLLDNPLLLPSHFYPLVNYIGSTFKTYPKSGYFLPPPVLPTQPMISHQGYYLLTVSLLLPWLLVLRSLWELCWKCILFSNLRTSNSETLRTGHKN